MTISLAGLGMLDGVGDEIGKNVSDLPLIDEDHWQAGRDLHDEARAARFDQRPQILAPRFRPKRRARNGLCRGSRRLAGLELREVKEVVDHAQQALRVLARGEQQLRLLGIERADALLEQQVQAHAHTGQRRLQLMAHGRDEIGLHFVQQSKPGDVLENHRGPEETAGLIAHADDAREHEDLMVVHAEDDHALEARRAENPRRL